MRYAAFLRGINLGSHRKVPMADLREALAGAGLSNPASYIRSGNVVFDTDLDKEATGRLVASTIAERYGFEVPVIVLDQEELTDIVDANPYAEEAAADPTKVHLTLLDPEPPASTWDPVDPVPPEDFQVQGGAVYVHLPNGMGRSQLAEQLARVVADVTATTRNWRTVLAMVDLLRDED